MTPISPMLGVLVAPDVVRGRASDGPTPHDTRCALAGADHFSLKLAVFVVWSVNATSSRTHVPGCLGVCQF